MGIEEALEIGREKERKRRRWRRIGRRTMKIILWVGKGEGQYKASESRTEIDEVERGQKRRKLILKFQELERRQFK